MLTPGQTKVLDFIKHYLAREGFSPSLAEIAERLGSTSRGSMHRQVQASAGVIRLLTDRQRCIELVEDMEGVNTRPDSLPPCTP
jgi:repressor LexA